MIGSYVIEAVSALDAAYGEASYTGMVIELAGSGDSSQAFTSIAAVVSDLASAVEAIAAVSDFYVEALDSGDAESSEIALLIVPGVVLGTVFLLTAPSSVFDLHPGISGAGDSTIFTIAPMAPTGDTWQLKPQ
jgi:hypothetical protein